MTEPSQLSCFYCILFLLYCIYSINVFIVHSVGRFNIQHVFSEYSSMEGIDGIFSVDIKGPYFTVVYYMLEKSSEKSNAPLNI